MSHTASPEVFISYSHHDNAWRLRLFDDYLPSTLGDCRVWADTQMRAGDQWEAEIERRLQSCSVAVLLVSERFLKSPFIKDRELPVIRARAANHGLRVVWVPIALARDALRARPELEQMNAALGFEDALPAQPLALEGAVCDSLRQRIRQQVLANIDPVGTELATRLAERYEVGQRIGSGNQASVYRARDRVLHRSVAIKALRDKDRRQDFMDDVRDAIRSAEAPNFVNIYDAASSEAAAFCVMRHVEGQSLRALLRAHPRGLPGRTMRDIFVKLTATIAHAHSLGVTHGNLKPSNIMLSLSQEPFVLPVRARRERGRDERRANTLIERVALARAAGQPVTEADQEDLAYLVPDHFADPFEPVDDRLVDQYMLGLLAHEMATGQSPQTLADPALLMRDGAAAFQSLVPINRVRRLCPQRIAEVVARMTARRPAKRFTDLGQVLQEPDLQSDLSLVLARDSYRRCAALPGFDSDFFTRFYSEFLRRCPQAGRYFEAFTPDTWQRQHRMLKEAVLLLLAYRQQNDGLAEPNVLSRIASSHAQIPGWAYEPFMAALVATVCGDPDAAVSAFDPECSDPAVQEQLEAHWRSALGAGIDYLRQRAGQVPAALAG